MLYALKTNEKGILKMTGSKYCNTVSIHGGLTEAFKYSESQDSKQVYIVAKRIINGSLQDQRHEATPCLIKLDQRHASHQQSDILGNGSRDHDRSCRP